MVHPDPLAAVEKFPLATGIPTHVRSPVVLMGVAWRHCKSHMVWRVRIGVVVDVVFESR